MKIERRTLQEQIGVAVNASVLTIRSHETPLELVAALGAATLHIQTGASRRGVTVASVAHVPRQRQDVIVGELAAALWHLRYGGQDGQLGAAIRLFAEWISYRDRMVKIDRSLLKPFAARVLHEWLSDRCIACGGSGKQEVTRSGQVIRPRGSMQRNAVFRPCSTCHGSRRRPPSETERRTALGIDIATFEAGRWTRHFNAALHWCSHLIAPTLKEPLTMQLERRRRHI